MFTLYGSKGSGSAVVEVALEKCGAPYAVVRASTWEPDSALAELERVNPLKQIPSLVMPDGTVMTESVAILIELSLEYPKAKLLPAEPAGRARALRGLVFIAANCYSAISISDYPERWCADPDDATTASVRKAARGQLHRYWELFADAFCPSPSPSASPDTTAQPFLSGAEPGALDYLAAVVSKWSGTRAHLKKHRPQFLALLQRIEAHPHVAPTFARHWDS
jgi:GST-like protein